MKKLILFTTFCFQIIFCRAQHAPVGYLDQINQNGGYGWAYDADGGTQPIYVHIYIDGRFYTSILANGSRPDLVSAGVAPNAEHGYSFTITGYDLTRAHEVVVYGLNYGGGGPNPVLMNSPVTIGTKPNGSSFISNVAGGSNIVIGTSDALAGAIGLLTWWNKSFIDYHDHGRELQSATSFDGNGECYNPTEAGSSENGTSSVTSSYLQYLYASGNYLETQTVPAFWIEPGHSAPGCGTAVNTTQRASHYFRKKVTIGMPGMAHVIKYQTEFEITENHNSGTFEVLTGYMPTEFSKFYTYEPVSQALSNISDGPGEQVLPIIFSTVSSSHAMGIYSPDLPDPVAPAYGYGRFRFGDCVKWNCVFRRNNIVPSTYKFRSYVMVGTLENVKVSMAQLYNYFRITANFSTNTVNVGTPTTFTDLTAGSNSETKYQWDIGNDGTIDLTTAGNFTYTFPYFGTYAVKLTVINGVAADHRSSIVKNIVVNCPDPHPYACPAGQAHPLYPLRVANTENNHEGINHEEINIYPNPASDVLTIETGSEEERIQLEIFNVFGQRVFKNDFVDKININISDFAPGIYMIKLNNGLTTNYKKVVIE
jgi:PKD repeat protein